MSKLPKKVDYINRIGLSNYIDKSEFEPNTFSYPTSALGKLYFSTIDSNSETLFEIHKNIWCENKSEILLIINPDKIHICDCKTKPTEQNTFSNIRIKSFSYGDNSEEEREILSMFRKKNIDSGAIWEDIHRFISKRIQEGKRKTVDKDLLDNLIYIRQRITKVLGNSENALVIAQKLIDRCLFIRFIEDKIELDNLKKVLTSNDTNKLLNLFEHYNSSLNGDLFEKGDITVLNKKVCQELRKIFGETYEYKSGQKTLFPYQFDKIPITLISNIYEKFLNPKDRTNKGAVYTPENLVEYFIDKIISNKRILAKIKSKKIRLLDPACGSGIFLVKFLEKYIDILEKESSKKLTIQEISSLIRHSIYGIDIDENALRVAAFSLYLKILDRLAPQEVKKLIQQKGSDKFMFPGLKNINLFHMNTLFDKFDFQYGFDIVVGNPPWGYKFEPTEKKQIKTHWPEVSRYQSSQCFLFRAEYFLNSAGMVALISNSSNFQNEQSENFRKKFISNFSITTLVNLAEVKEITFGAQSEPAILVIYCKKQPRNNIHIYNLNLSKFSKLTKILIDSPSETIPEHELEKNPNWVPYINGYYRYMETIKIIQRDSTPLDTYKQECQVGVMKYSKKKHGDKESFYKKYFSNIQKKGFYLIVDSLKQIKNYEMPQTAKYIDYDNADLDRERSIELFKGKKLIISRNWPFRAFIDNETRIYDGNFIIFKPKRGDEKLLELINHIIISNVSRFYFSISNVLRKTGNFPKINKGQLLAFPMPLLRKSFVGKIDTRKSSTEIQKNIYRLYNLNYKQIRQIEDFIKIDQKRGIEATETDVLHYIDEFKEGYRHLMEQSKYLNFKFYCSDFMGAILHLSISNTEDPFEFKKIDKLLGIIFKHQIEKYGLITETKRKIYDGNNFYLYKSNKLEDWTRSEAINDLNEELKIIFSKLKE